MSCLQAYPDMGDAQSHQLNLLEGSTPVRAYGGSTDAQGGRALVVSAPWQQLKESQRVETDGRWY